MEDRREFQLYLTRAQQTSVNAWVDAKGHKGSISLEHPDWGEGTMFQYVEVKLYDGEGEIIDKATFFSTGEGPKAEGTPG